VVVRVAGAKEGVVIEVIEAHQDRKAALGATLLLVRRRRELFRRLRKQKTVIEAIREAPDQAAEADTEVEEF
jgi:hypothetical protein